MNEIEHEGKTYVLKTQVEAIIKDRVGKVAQRATAAEQALEAAQSRLEKAEKAMSSVDILNQQLAEMQNKRDHDRDWETYVLPSCSISFICSLLCG